MSQGSPRPSAWKVGQDFHAPTGFHWVHFFLLHQKPELRNQQPQQMPALPGVFPSVWPSTLTRERLLRTAGSHGFPFLLGLCRPSVDECLLPELPCLWKSWKTEGLGGSSRPATETGTLENWLRGDPANSDHQNILIFLTDKDGHGPSGACTTQGYSRTFSS